ncbi:ATP-binding protein [Methanolobus bombayensis]|uniref:ATP-binding protein n=1 Tax=Methanolobus bombayensis TaxID=38023 RepID=UPI001AE29C20|nr:ATP-binding protein [Methanolobus bombayensis]MBP1910638.1 AAA+ ATPase superfamily predicted ATPase [Methanolobus bombayensis]
MTIKSEFINRTKELEYIENEYSKGDFRFISLIGRRRLGKTRFIGKFLEGKPKYCYILVPELNGPDVRMEVAKSLHESFGISFLGLPSWDEIFEKLFSFSYEERVIVVFDEFQRFSRIDNSIFSYLQKYIDMSASNSRLFLLVSGSSIGMMHQIFEYVSPLYGRRTGQMFFDVFRFSALSDWFPEFPLDMRTYIYTIYGGTPKYLEEVESPVLQDNIKTLLSGTSVLYNEPEVLLKTELRESNTYFNILKNITSGIVRSSEIAESSGIKSTSIDYYLSILINDLDLVRKEVPVCDKESSRKAVYRINDNFFRFWFRFMYPAFSELEIGSSERTLKNINAEIDAFTASVFEDICKQFLIEMNMNSLLPFAFEKIGRQWGKFKGKTGKNTYEIDLVAINSSTKQILLAECKWNKKKLGPDVIVALLNKAKYVNWYSRERKEYFAVFSRSGFTPAAQSLAEERGVLLFDLEDIGRFI